MHMQNGWRVPSCCTGFALLRYLASLNALVVPQPSRGARHAEDKGSLLTHILGSRLSSLTQRQAVEENRVAFKKVLFRSQGLATHAGTQPHELQQFLLCSLHRVTSSNL